MKTNIFLISFFFLLNTGLWAQPVTKTFQVSGNCSMCKKTIEDAALKKGALSASWEKSTGVLTVNFDPAVLSQTSLLQAIADAGYDNEGVKADEAAYQALPECCKYRAEDASKHTSSCCMKDGACKGGKKCCTKNGGDKSCCAKGTCDKEGGCCSKCGKESAHQCSSADKEKSCSKGEGDKCCKKKRKAKSGSCCKH